MFNFTKGLDFWSFLYAIGLIFTLIVSIGNLFFSLHTNKKTLFINTVTSERMRWITKLKDYLAEFYSNIQYFSRDSDESINKVNEVNLLRTKIKLYLNPVDDKNLIDLVDELYELLKKSREKAMYGKTDLSDEEILYKNEELEMKLSELIKFSQKTLKHEWERVKIESVKGYMHQNNKDTRKFKGFKLFSLSNLNIVIYIIIAIIFFLVGSILTKHNSSLVGFIMNQRGNILIGIMTGIISSVIISEIYKNIEEKKAALAEFEDNKQSYSKYLGVIRNEIELFKNNNDITTLLRVLNEPRWYNGFKDTILTDSDRTTLENTYKLLEDFEVYLRKSEINSLEMTKFSSRLLISQLDILKMKAQK